MLKTFRDCFGERLKERREACGFSTVEKLARAISVRGQTISNYEAGKTLPDAEILCKLAGALSCTVDYLTMKEDAPTHDAASIAKVTGLYPKAIESIAKHNETENKFVPFFVSAMLCSDRIDLMSKTFVMLIDTIGKEREKAGGTIDESRTHDELDEFIDHRHMIDGARYSVDRQFNYFLDETEQKAMAMDLDMEVDDGKGEE